MAEAARRLKANRLIEGKPCAACGRTFVFGDDAAVCTACEALHDGRCWDERGGCAGAGCVNAPLERLAAPTRGGATSAATEEVPPGKKLCPHCGRLMGVRMEICPKCKRAPTPDGVYRGHVTNAPGAVASMVLGTIGLVFFGVILGIIAIVKANAAKKLIASNPRYGGSGFATAGLVLGIIDLAAFVLILVVKLGSRGGGF